MKFNLFDLPLGYVGYNKKTGEFIITLTQGDMNDEEFAQEKSRVKNMLISQGLEVKQTADNQFTVKPENPNNEDIVRVHGKKAKNHSITKDRVSKVAFGCDEELTPDYLMQTVDDADSWDSGEKSKRIDTGKKIYALVTLSFDKLPEGFKDLIGDRFVRAVHDTVTSLINEGNMYISLQQIAAAMGGYSQKRRRATEEFLKEIERAMQVLRAYIKIDATNEQKGYKFSTFEFDGSLIPYDKIVVANIDGQKVKAYRIFRESVLYSYASQKKQVITVPMFMLELPDKINMTRDNIILRNYLLEQIETMKIGAIGRVMLFDTIYQVLGMEEKSRTEKKRIRETVKAFLNNWADLKFIKGYNLVIEGRTIRGVSIKFFDEKLLKG